MVIQEGDGAPGPGRAAPGRVKVLDFGIARIAELQSDGNVEPAASPVDSFHTLRDTLLGSELEHQILLEARRKGLDAKSFVLDLLRETLASKVSSVEARRESELLEEINRGFPEEVWARYRELVAQRQDETLSDKEHAELIALIDIRPRHRETSTGRELLSRS